VEGGTLLPAAVGADKASGGALTRALKFSRFTGKSGQMLEVLAPSGQSLPLAAGRPGQG
jgi:leucyl aminopeptidase